MTETDEPQDQTRTEPAPARTGVATENLRDYQRLRRARTDRKIAGVAGGLGRHLNIDPTVLRVLFVVLVFFGGAGLLLYAVAWLIVPEEDSDKAVISSAPSTRNALLIVAAVLAGLLVLGDSWGPVGGGFFPWPLALVAIIVLGVVLATRDGSSGEQPTTPAAPGSPPPPPAGTTSAAGPSSGTSSGMSYPTSASPPGAYPPPSYPTSHASAPPPEDRGPKLFGFTLALVAVALGVLGLYEAAGGAVADAAYAALALAVIGVMLVVGSVAGRPGGLILLGIIAAIALAVSATVERYEVGRSGQLQITPSFTAEVDPEYSLFAGEIDLDLTEVIDPENYQGRTIAIRAEAGEVVVLVPEGVDVGVDARIDIGGEIDIDGLRQEGRDPQVRTQIDGGVGVPVVNLDIELTVGTITVTQIPEANAS